ncbi:phospholipase [Alloactinosynnema sp. L-07]|uniref:alpha/beta hydrolase family protein n=1 Tax=Alloactinosynnema sp. L-07 TaxID=1653480 RepID=UPI0012F8FB55|nr:phospholipase [Alloactinosynnema sp. L-07]
MDRRSALAAAALAVTLAMTPTGAIAAPVEPTSPDYAVGRRDVVLVDSTRPTAPDPRGTPGRPDRTIPVRLLYPASGAPGGPVTDQPRSAPGVFPLVVFSHGVTATGPAYEQLVAYIAQSGYVVALPTYPLTSGPGARIDDYVNQPADVSFIIDSVLAMARDRHDPLFGHVHRFKIAAAGHSLGAITTVGVTYHEAVRDSRIDAAVALAGAELGFPGGDYLPRPGIPLHLVHGANDATVPVGFSDSMYANATGPATYLRLHTAGHIDLFFPPAGELTIGSTVAFLDAYVKHRPQALRAVPKQVAATGLGTWQQK